MCHKHSAERLRLPLCLGVNEKAVNLLLTVSSTEKNVEIDNESENSATENSATENSNDIESEKERSEINEESEKERKNRKRKYGLMRLPTATTSLKNQPAVTPKIFSENGAN